MKRIVFEIFLFVMFDLWQCLRNPNSDLYILKGPTSHSPTSEMKRRPIAQNIYNNSHTLILVCWIHILLSKHSKVGVVDHLYLRDTDEVFLADSPFPLRKKVFLSQVSHSSSAKLLPDSNTKTRNAGNSTDMRNVSILNFFAWPENNFYFQAARDHSALLVVILNFLLCHSIM